MNGNDEATSSDKEEQRLQAVLALFKGQAVAQVCQQYNICRSDLYKYRRRALAAIRSAMKDQQRGPKRPSNRLPEEKEQRIKLLSQRNPTLSSYQVNKSLSPDSPSPRTIQRVRKRLRLPRLKKRKTLSFKAHRFTDDEKQLIRKIVEAKLYLGPYRLAWDLQNQYGLRINPSTVRRVKRAILRERHPPPASPVWHFYERHHPHSLWHGDFFEKVTLMDEDRTAYHLTLLDDYSRAYVYCDLLREPTQNDTIRAMIAAMRKYQTIPKGVVFDNGSQFKGYLLSAFCSNLGIKLIHSSVRHPQTNGKLERVFRDDHREYYDQFNEWIFDELRQGLPEYVHYRNEVRGHYALKGKPSTTRLAEQNWFALPSVLDSLEGYARHPLGSTKVDLSCCIRVLGRNGYIPKLRYGQRVSLIETLDGLEATTEDGRVYLLRNYRRLKQVPSCHCDELPFCVHFEEYSEGHCPRIAVA
jgi:transposase InsO family protein